MIKIIMFLIMVFRTDSTFSEQTEIGCTELQKSSIEVQKNKPKKAYEPQKIFITCGSSESSSASNNPPPSYENKQNIVEQSVTFWKVIETILKLLVDAAWPLTALGIAVIYKKDISQLLERLRKGKFGSSEWEFDDLLNDAVFESRGLDENVPDVSLKESELASADQRASIISSWLEVETALMNLVEKRKLRVKQDSDSFKRRYNSLSAIRSVQEASIIDSSYISLLHDLRVMRNEAAHTSNFNASVESAIKYAQLAKEVVAALNKAANANLNDNLL